MLRLGFSKISLDRTDVEFHIKTHNRRQAARRRKTFVPNIDQTNSQVRRSSRLNNSSSAQNEKKTFNTLPLRLPASELSDKDFPVSKDPVPHDSRAFWDRVLAEAGTPTRTRTVDVGNGSLIEHSNDWLENHRSIRPSIDDSGDLSVDSQDDRPRAEDGQSRTTNSNHSSLESYLSTQKSISDDNEIRKESTTSLNSTRLSRRQSRFSNLFRRRPKSFDKVEAAQPPGSSDLGLDGNQSDIPRNLHLDAAVPSRASPGGSLNDGLLESTYDQRTNSSSFGVPVVHEPTQHHTLVNQQIQHPHTVSPAVVSTPSIDPQPSQNTNPRTPSTPEIASVLSLMTPLLDAGAADDRSLGTPVVSPNLLSLPPRRRRTYRPRSETYSYDTSEASSAVFLVRDRHSTLEGNLPRSTEATRPDCNPTFRAIPNTRNSALLSDNPSSNGTDLSPATQANGLPRRRQRPPPRRSSQIGHPGHPFMLNHSMLTPRSSSHPQDLPDVRQDTFLSPNAITNAINHQIHSSGSSANMRLESSPNASHPRPQARTNSDRHCTISHSTSFSDSSSRIPSSRSSLSPLAPPFVPDNRNLTPQYPLPPPFGATPRTVSFSHSVPHLSSPAAPVNTSSTTRWNPPTSPSPASPANPRTPHPNTPRARARHRTNFTIYDDNQAPHTQPQTPADLHRHRRHNIFSTVPARQHVPHIMQTPSQQRINWLPVPSERVMNWQNLTHPPDRIEHALIREEQRPPLIPLPMSDVVSRDAENADSVTEEEREIRRVWNEGIRLGRHERSELDESPGLRDSPRR